MAFIDLNDDEREHKDVGEKISNEMRKDGRRRAYLDEHSNEAKRGIRHKIRSEMTGTGKSREGRPVSRID